jgi:hypothetical protein
MIKTKLDQSTCKKENDPTFFWNLFQALYLKNSFVSFNIFGVI